MSRKQSAAGVKSWRFRLYFEIYTLQMRKLMAYRAEFWFRFLGGLFANATVAYFLWKAVFAVGDAPTLGGRDGGFLGGECLES
ncbi:hypothetical protein E3A20_25840 [Planctomyces bekefii]|uniref:Uncharacterized protein n=1 Tax=Planctomyces bekefii TaxID=1653850 RepID=A0A5C6M121_9PLAN|nr:hypothetical protein E3A20_25840 [Planctomyces bekefii]